MMASVHRSVRASAVLSVLLLAGAASGAGVGYGVSAAGTLFSFNLDAPLGSVSSIGNVGFVPEGLDFRPGTSTLYAVDVGPTTTQVYTIDINTGAATPVGAGFATAPAAGGYNLGGAQTFGFDFNPTTLQVDNSMRIRLISSGGSNLRLNSSTGGVAGIDAALSFFGGGDAPQADAAAYINSASATQGGTTTLFVMDPSTDSLYTQNPPNGGVLNLVGPFGVTINAQASISFDILTDPSSVDTGIGGDSGFAVYRRADAPIGNPGAWVLYNVNLGTGSTTGGTLVGSQDLPADFTGGFAVLIPAPGLAGVGAMSGLAALAGLRRRR